ncbi:MAG: fumarate hydratase [Candidatus Omnitrophota bacterium]
MRRIPIAIIKKKVAELCKKANWELREDVKEALGRALKNETNRRARKILKAILENAGVAATERLAICQDTGLPVVFVEVGQKVLISGGNLKTAINTAVAAAYRKSSLRNSIIPDPLKRKSPGFGPAIIHTEIVPGEKIKLTVLPKGFGCENKSQLKMFLPTASIEEIRRFIVESVKKAGPDACPPYVVGVGIGGTADYASLLAKKALLRNIDQRPKTKDQRLAAELLREINKLNLGPMGLGGKTTCLAVNIETFPTHLAGLPVAVNISCHALRSATAIIYGVVLLSRKTIRKKGGNFDSRRDKKHQN